VPFATNSTRITVFLVASIARSLTVPEEKATPIPLRGRQAMMISDVEHGGTVLTWREANLQFSIAGALEPDEIVRIAESLDLASKNLETGQDAE